MSYTVAMILFDDVTILDFIGPYEVFNKVSDWEIKTCGLQAGIVRCEGGLQVKAEYELDAVLEADILFIPGGTGVNALIQNPAFLKEITRLGLQAKYITSVCTGSLVLAAAGLLDGYTATTHWQSLHFLEKLGAIVSEERVVRDDNRITGGGITAGIDFGLQLVARLESPQRAKEIELFLEYNPQPPYGVGHPSIAPEELVFALKEKSKDAMARREKIIDAFLESK
ncbi:MAG: ThiJ/PfpI [Cytophagaceae bacterium]|jgi:cyclohexyl-isocyanide hydratase|nr:ThiJ/PfpI [Cytophagaceae bacterium]